MQHFQHKKKASKQFLVGAGQLSLFQLQLCQKEPFWNIMALLVTMNTGGFPCPFQTTVATAPAFQAVKQPFGKFVMRVPHALSPAQWGPGHSDSTHPWGVTHAQISVSTRHGPAAVGLALDCRGLLTWEQIWCLVWPPPAPVQNIQCSQYSNMELLCTQILMRPCHKIPAGFGIEGDLEDHLCPSSQPWTGILSPSPGCSEPYPVWPWELPVIGSAVISQLLWETCASASPPAE